MTQIIKYDSDTGDLLCAARSLPERISSPGSTTDNIGCPSLEMVLAHPDYQGWVEYVESVFNPATHKIGPFGTVVELSQDELSAIELARVTQATSMLWQAAHDYETSRISGSAIGLVTKGEMLGKPKATAVAYWIARIWGFYYQRCALVVAGAEPDLDWTVCGDIPHTVPELMVEGGF